MTIIFHVDYLLGTRELTEALEDLYGVLVWKDKKVTVVARVK